MDKYPYKIIQYYIMAFSIINQNKTVNITSNKLNSSHIGNLYGGLKNQTTNNIIGNLSTISLPQSITNAGGWCTITLKDIDSTKTGIKIYAECTENTSNTNRECQVKLKYGDNQSTYYIKIVQSGKEENIFYDTFYFQFDLASFNKILPHIQNAALSMNYPFYLGDTLNAYTSEIGHAYNIEYIDNLDGSSYFGFTLNTNQMDNTIYELHFNTNKELLEDNMQDWHHIFGIVHRSDEFGKSLGPIENADNILYNDITISNFRYMWHLNIKAPMRNENLQQGGYAMTICILDVNTKDLTQIPSSKESPYLLKPLLPIDENQFINQLDFFLNLIYNNETAH